MLYRILTENTKAYRRSLIREASKSFPDGFTLLSGSGYWHGGSERCLVLEVTDQPESAVLTFSRTLKAVNAQESVLVQRIPTHKPVFI